MEHLDRIEKKAYRAWLVRIQRGGVIERKCFSDSKCGGKRESLKAALRWRDQQVAALPPKQALTKASSRSTTGIPGVYPIYSEGPKRRIEGYCATWPLKDGRRVRRFFYAGAECTLKQAFAAAVEERRKGIAAQSSKTAARRSGGRPQRRPRRTRRARR